MPEKLDTASAVRAWGMFDASHLHNVDMRGHIRNAVVATVEYQEPALPQLYKRSFTVSPSRSTCFPRSLWERGRAAQQSCKLFATAGQGFAALEGLGKSRTTGGFPHDTRVVAQEVGKLLEA